MTQKVVLRIINMTNDKVKQKAIEAAADILGVDSIATELKSQELMVSGDMDIVAMVKKLKKVIGLVDIVSVGPTVVEQQHPVPPPPDQEKKKIKKKKKKQDKKVGVIEEKKKQDDEESMEF